MNRFSKLILCGLLSLLACAQPALAAVAYQSSSTVAPATRTNTTITAPTGIANGDLLVILISSGGASAVTITAPAGFSSATGFPLSISKADPWTTRGYCFFKIASGESGNYTCTHASAVSNAIMYRISGSDTSTPLNPTPTINNANSTTTTATGLTTATNDSLVIFYSITWDGQGGAAPTGSTPTFTERYDSGTGGVIYAADGVLATAGATGNKTNANNNTIGNPFAASLIAVQAPTGGGAASPNRRAGNILGNINSGFNGSPQ